MNWKTSAGDVSILLIVPMADSRHASTDEAFGSLSHSLPGERHWFQDTVPIAEIDASLTEKVSFNTEFVDSDGMSENEGEVILDSEDEGICRNSNCHSETRGALVDDDSSGGPKNVSHQQPKCDEILNYIASDEPGEASQANALEFVDRLLLSNDVGVSPASHSTSTVRKNLSPVTSMSGPRCLAKRLVCRNLARKDGAFEWDGGTLAESFLPFDFGGFQEAGHVDSKVGSNSSNVYEEHSMKLHQQVEVPSRSNSTTGNLHHQEMCTIRNLPEISIENRWVKKPEKQLHSFSAGHELVDCSGEGHTLDLFDIGFQTQMAAEAIEALSHGPSAYHKAADHANQGCQNSVVDSSKALTKSEVHSKKPCVQDGALFNFEGITRVSKPRTRPSRRTGKLSEHRDSAILTTKSKRDSTSPNESLNIKSSKLIVQRKGEEDAQKNNVHCEYEACSSTLVENMSVGGQEAPGKDRVAADKPKLFKDGSDSLGVGMRSQVGIMKYRRRKRTPLSNKPPEISKDGSDKLKISVGESDSLGEGMLSPEVGIMTYRRRKSTPLSDKPSEMLSTEGTCTKTCSNASKEVRSTEPRQEKQSTGVKLGLNTLLKLDAWECSKRKRTHRKMLPRTNGFGNQYSTFKRVDGEEHYEKMYNKNLPKTKPSLLKELNRLSTSELALSCGWKDLRKRRHVASSVRVLFSQHLEINIIKMQKKIIGRLGISIASSLSDATHFIADEFLRTRNMLEAIALGKPVVTHLWLESCGQAGCLIDVKNYMLRDAKKEKDIGFSLTISLASASKRPLLLGRRVFLTPNIKPDREMISGLVEAARGQVMDREDIFSGKIPDDLLILSCEEDHQLCSPFIDKGLTVYSTELLLNGIVIQKLEYARHQLFAKRVERSRFGKR